MDDPNNPAYDAGQLVGGYRLLRSAFVSANRSWFYELVHEATGARHIHLSREDAENTFAVAFQTVPQDATGVAHILEHTVLCGSRRYPVRDPFFSMLRRSLSTFMNAFTASDWTMYPFCTQNRKDYYNLMDVYLDAVFHPRLDELSFKQEGHRVEIVAGSRQDPESLRLEYKGVVYNEMKGAMSSPDQVMVRSILEALYPDTTYRYNSGGDPAQIPRLTHRQLVDFHRRHYHPSNAFFYTYGNLPLADHLAQIGERVLAEFEPIARSPGVPPQPRWDAPREASFAYPVDPEQDTERKHQACLAWLTADIRDHRRVLELVLLEQVLLGNAGSPMRKALMASGLGSALCDGCGYDAENRDTLFVIGLKDTAADAPAKIEALIFEVLGGLCDKGIDRELIDSAIHQLEFHRKEITNTPYPYGLKLLMSFAAPWFHGSDPLNILHLDELLADLRRDLERGPIFEDLLRRQLLENPHRVRLALVPDKHLAKAEAEREAAELAALKRVLGPAELEKIEQDAARLRQLQEAAEDVSCLPTLAREDIPPSVAEVAASGAEPALGLACYAQGTSGVSYLAAAAGAARLPEDLLPLAPFFSFALSRIGTRERDYAEMARRIDRYTGGIGLAVHARTRFDGRGGCLPFVSLNAKCLERHQAPMCEIVAELLAEHDFSDAARLKTLLFEYRAALESAVVHNGHGLAISLAARNFSPARALSELWSGVTQLGRIKQMTGEVTDEALARLAERLSAAGRRLLAQPNVRLAVIGEEDALADARRQVAALRRRLPEQGEEGFGVPALSAAGTPVREGWITATAVSFVALAFETQRLSHPDAPALAVAAKLLRAQVLHPEIREKGGAYGGFAVYNPEDGIFCMASYRDPHIVRTVEVFERAAGEVLAAGVGEEDVKEAVLQVCSEIDKPDPPGPAARKAFYRTLIGLSDPMRRDFKARVLETGPAEVRAVLERYLRDPDRPRSLAVISGEAQLAAANRQINGPPLELARI